MHDHEFEHVRHQRVFDEFICHFPYAVFALAISFIVLSVLTALIVNGNTQLSCQSFHQLFHSFHYLHIVFAAAGTISMFFKHSQRLVRGLIVGTIAPAIFCVLSDIVLPYLGGTLLGVPMRLHICFFHEYTNIGIFLLIGVATGFVLRFHANREESGTAFYRWSHFGHIMLSALASLSYIVSHGFFNWTAYMGPVYLVLVIAVVVPCTLSDVIVPVFFAQADKR